MGISRRALDETFERSTTLLGGTLPIRKTSVGIWVPTPVRVIAKAAMLLQEMGLLGDGAPEGIIVDAGTGDGRVAAVPVSCDPTQVIYGIEADAVFYTQAVANLKALETRGLPLGRVQLVEADYCDVRTYESRGLNLGEIAMFLNYPDGHQRQLARFVAEHAGEATRLCLLTHDRSVVVDDLELRDQRTVCLDAELDWLLSIYQRAT